MKSFFLVGFLLLTISACYSQQGVNDQEVRLSALPRVAADEAVFISQISENAGIFSVQSGSHNYVDVQVKSASQNISYYQIGDDNFISSQLSAKSTFGSIIQLGTKNGSFQFINAPNENISLHLNQVGDKLHFEMHGSNSIGDKLKLNMTGNSKAIIVRNFR